MNTLSKADLDRMHGAQIKDLAKRGILRVMSTTTAGHIPYTEYPEYQKHAKLKGTRITLSEASRQFDIPHPTISRWVSRGLITILERTAREIYLDRADMAYCAEIYKKNRGAGKWLFNDDRTPYVPLTR